MPDGKVVEGEVDINEIARKIMNAASSSGSGALVLFVGFVKGVVDGAEVKELEYSAYEPYASRKLREIAEEECREEGVHDVLVYHRVGRLKPGEPTVYIFVAAQSRSIAFDKARRVLERVKHEVPIFKLEKRADGEYWVIGDGVRMRRPLSQKREQG
ncbi:MAG: molybdenum cofactor biosynthesis protein MoaE [Desulfurococcales archaeon]|nr:molybdenum cofactor biosynthesis protein MoaE [Desulfurococcales archaeon]